MRKITLIISLAVVLIASFTILIKSKADRPRFVTIRINNTQVRAELAVSNEERRKGLSNRSSLKENEGMLFLFPDKAIHAFWMKGMNFPLDIIWIAEEEVIDISENLPVAQGADHILPRYLPEKPVNMVLEVKAGFAKRHGIRKGDKINLSSHFPPYF